MTPMPLVQNGSGAPVPDRAFDGAFSPLGARAGWLLRHGAWSEAHQIAQDLATPEGSYWHSIIHRQEPDAWNAGYWHGKTGRHPIHEPMRAKAAELGFNNWTPIGFIEFCEAARQNPGSTNERLAIAVQDAEWEMLFAWCTRPAEEAV